MIDIPWVLTTRDMFMLRLGVASYGDAPPAVRATAIAMGFLASPADMGGYTATIAADVPTINLATNVDRRVPYTMAAMEWLREMDVLHDTARLIGSTRVQFLDCRGLVSRADPVLDGVEPAGQIESETYPYGEAAA